MLTRFAPLLGLLILAGCSSNPIADRTDTVKVEERDALTKKQDTEVTPLQPGGDNRLVDLTRRPPGVTERQPWDDPANGVLKRSFYFDYDSYVVRDGDRSLVEAHSQFLLKTPNTGLTIQGNTDERGSREYNLALAQKRAEAVKKLLQLKGVAEGNIETVSYGEEKPRATGHDEAAWAENRRADLDYRKR